MPTRNRATVSHPRAIIPREGSGWVVAQGAPA